MVQFNAKATKPYEKLVLDLPITDKIQLLKGVLNKLEYSKPSSLRLVKSHTSDKFHVGSIERKKVQETI